MCSREFLGLWAGRTCLGTGWLGGWPFIHVSGGNGWVVGVVVVGFGEALAVGVVHGHGRCSTLGQSCGSGWKLGAEESLHGKQWRLYVFWRA